MKKPRHIKEAESIGNDSYELMNFMQLPKNASKENQIAALREDESWQRGHYEGISSQIFFLIDDIEG